MRWTELLELTAPVRTVIVRLLLLFNTRTAYKYITVFSVGLALAQFRKEKETGFQSRDFS